MTTAELVSKVAKDGKCTKAGAESMLECIIDNLVKLLKKGDKITIPGFGTFSVARRKARLGRNPQTGAPIKIAARRTIKFKPTSSLRNLGG